LLFRLPGTLLFDKKYTNDNYSSLLEVIQIFLNESNDTRQPSTACLAVAGPVSNNRAVLTNHSSWDINGAEIGQALSLKGIRVINDFVAMGYGLLTLNEEKECIILQKGTKKADAPIACIGAGTGLGECYLTPTGTGGHECYGSEGGHAEFAPRNDVSVQSILKMLICCVSFVSLFIIFCFIWPTGAL
jgi:glucokinase